MSEVNSTLSNLFSMGFLVLGDSRDFTNNSIQVTLARGSERLVWTFPLKRGVISIESPEGTSYLKATPDQVSFDVVTAVQDQTVTPGV